MKFSPPRVFPAVLKTVPSVNRRQTGSPFHKLVLQVQGGGKPSEQRAAKLLNEALTVSIFQSLLPSQP